MNPEDPTEGHESLRKAVDGVFALDADEEYDDLSPPWWARPLTSDDWEQVGRNREQWDDKNRTGAGARPRNRRKEGTE